MKEEILAKTLVFLPAGACGPHSVAMRFTPGARSSAESLTDHQQAKGRIG